MKARKLTVVFAAVCGVHLGWSQTTTLAGDVNECYGNGQMSRIILPGGYYEQDGDEEYYNVTLGQNATWNTKGYILRVRGTLTIGQNAVLTDSSTGGDGGDGGAGGQGGYGYPPHYPATAGSPGDDGEESTVHPGKAGNGGPGGGGGGGGGGAWDTLDLSEGDVPGGDGGDGGDGGNGGGYVRIYVYNLDNQGDIHADGQDAPQRGELDGAQNGSQGEFNEYWVFPYWRDASGGGGGGGGGGDGGDGGTVLIYYANLINLGQIHADGGTCGFGGDEGGSQCGRLDCPARLLGQHAEYGAPGGAPGKDPLDEYGCGWGGDGGESDGTDYCGTTAHGYPGQPFPPVCPPDCNGADGVVIRVQDCNCNETPDDEDITNGVSEDCQPNDMPDECDIDSGASGDCNINLIPDECDSADCPPEVPWCDDCQPNGVIDECDIIFTASCEQLSPIGHGFPQNCVIPSPPEAVSDVTLRFKAIADLDRSDEYIDVYINGWYMGRVFESDASQCPLLRDVDAIDPEVSATWYNLAVGGGDAVITMVASSAVNANLCQPSWISVYVIYTTDEDDCNLNLVPDECDVPPICTDPWPLCSLDCNTNLVPDECESCSAFGVRSCAVHGPAGRLCLDMGTNGRIDGGIDPRTCAITELKIDLDVNACLAEQVVAVYCEDVSTNQVPWGGTVPFALSSGGGNTVIAQFSPALPDETYCTIELDCGAEICVRSCEGDVNRDGCVTPTDCAQIKPRFGDPVTDDNCQWDFNCDGVINPVDLLQVKARFGYTAPECP